MNTSTRARKALFIAIFLVLATFSGGQIARAQTVDTPATQAQIQQLQTTLVTLLTQLIAQLQQQIADLLTQQSATAQKVDTIVQNTTPVFGITATNTPTITPLRLLAGQAGSIISYLGGKDLSDAEKADSAYHGYPVDKSLVSISANKTLDLSKTELWVDGVKRSITTTSYRTVIDGGLYPRQDFYISPNIYSFATGNSNGSYTEKVQLRLSDSEGQQVSTYTTTCLATPIGNGAYSAPNCNNMPLSQEGN